MAKRLVSFRIKSNIIKSIKEEASKRNTTLSAIVEERLNPYAEFKT